MYEFLDKLIAVITSYVTSKAFLKQLLMDAVTTLGVKEQLIFPEIDYDKVKVRGMDIVIVTTANTDEEARELLSNFGMPFRNL